LLKYKYDHNEKDKVLIIFTICFLHFYSNFSYDEKKSSFEEYYNQDLINLCTKYNVSILDTKQFKIFCYTFYFQIIKEIKNLNYEYFHKMYVYYNPIALEEEKIIFRNNNNNYKFNNKCTNNILSFFKYYINTFNHSDSKYEYLRNKIQKIVNTKLIKPLISTTERAVDMVLSVKDL